MRPLPLGRYLLTELVGRGGMGTVYRAKDTQDGQTVAVKVLHESRLSDPKILARFRQEAHILEALDHPNIAAYFGHGDEEVVDPGTGQTIRVVYLALEWVSGRDLGETLKTREFSLTEALDLTRQVLFALENAHRIGIIHRDLNPANLRITPQFQVKLLDFGLAKVVEEASLASSKAKSFNTTRGSVLGTASYLAPEQLTSSPVDARTDLFGLGILLYRMVTGTLPFEGRNLIRVIESILRGEVQRPRELNPDLPEVVESVVLRLLHKNPEDRFPNASAVLAALAGL